jgi:hypothetical protein
MIDRCETAFGALGIESGFRKSLWMRQAGHEVVGNEQ